MKKTIYPALALLLLATACKKDKSTSNNGIDSKDNLLTDPATGWKRVSIVPFTGLGRGASPYNGMKGFDLQKADGKLAVLYTQHSLDPVVHAASDYFFKAVVAENATATDVQEISFGIFSGGGNNSPYTYYGQFLPNTAKPIFTGMDYNNNYIELRDQEGDIYAGAPAYNYPTFKYLPDGEFIAGSMWVTHESYIWHYKNPPNPLGDFSSTYRPGIIDGNKRLFNIPIKAADGNYYEFSLCNNNNTVTFLTIRCREDRVYGGTPPNYEIVDAGAATDWPQSGFSPDYIELLTYDHNSAAGELTFVFGCQNSLFCYRWKQGTLTQLWQTSLSADTDFSNAVKVYSNKNMLNEWRLKPDGTFYVLGNIEQNAPRTEDPITKLWEVNGSGIKTLATLTYAQTIQKGFEISTCRYIDGAYYALAYPTSDGNYRIGDPHFHLEIVKLNP
jgi:hypothetical protein